MAKFVLTQDGDVFSEPTLPAGEQVEVYGQGGDDTIYLYDAAPDYSGPDVIYGGAGTDSVYTDGPDTIYGGGGNDYLSTVLNLDILSGVAMIDGGSGNDYAVFNLSTTTQPVGELVLTTTANGWSLVVDGQQTAKIINSEQMVFDARNLEADVIRVEGRDGGDNFSFGQGHITVAAGGGDDILSMSGLSGQSLVDGGAGVDRFNFYGKDLTEALTVTVDSAGGMVFQTSPGNSITLTSFENVEMSGTRGADRVTLGAGDDYVIEDESTKGNDLYDMGDGSDIASGGKGKDTLIGGSGDDQLVGGTGNDRIIGGAGADLMGGNEGADRFVYASASESAAASADRIGGFEVGIDKFDLAAIDANANGGTGNDAFVFVGTAGFTAAGQIRVTDSADGCVIEVNSSGSGGAEMKILIDGLSANALTAGDFIL